MQAVLNSAVMATDPEVVVIGGGAVGTSILYHLTNCGMTNVSLFEKDQLGSGATSKGVGGVRDIFSHPMNIKAGTRNLAYYRRFAEETGVNLALEETGYLYLYNDGEGRGEWAERSSQLRDYGVPTRLLDPESVRELFPPLAKEMIAGGFYASECLHLDPYTVTQGFASAAQERGAAVHTHTPIERLQVTGGSVESVVTPEETLEPDYVVNAAGPWGPRLAETVGLDLHIDLSARRVAVTEQLIDQPSPLIIDQDRRCYFRTEQNGSMLLCDIGGDITDVQDPAEIQSGSIGYDYYLDALSKVSELVPAVEDAKIINGWAGVQTHTPDGHPILGTSPIDGFLLACGFNGLGVMFAPTIGAAIADIITSGTTDAIDIERLGLNRFEDPPERQIIPEELA
jgi:sarcosine oxidase subunit beta